MLKDAETVAVGQPHVHEEPLRDLYKLAPEELLTRVEAARYLGIQPTTLAIWASSLTRRQALPIVKVGRLARYVRADLDAYIASRRRVA